MKIRTMTATFGKLDRTSLELGPGLNIIQGPNEGGKSTWSAFLRAMLYGIPTNQRDKAGFLAEKNRYQPWSGAPMAGEMRLEWRGREILLRRKGKGASPFGALEAVDAATGAPIPELTAADAGELLVGAEREVFERSAFVGQSALAVEGSAALEKRIGGLLTAGQEEVSFSQVDRQLRDWLNRRKHNKTGLIPKLEAEIAQGEERLARFQQARRQREEGLADLDALKARRAGLEADKIAHRAAAEGERWARFEAAQADYDRAKAEYEDQAALFQNQPGAERLAEAQEDLQYIQSLGASLRIKEEEVQRAREEVPEAPAAPGLSGGQMGFCAVAAVVAAGLCFLLSGQLLALPWMGGEALTGGGLDGGTRAFLSVLVGLGVGALGLLLCRRAQRGKGAQAARQVRLRWKEQIAALEREADALRTEREGKLAELLAFVHTFAPTVSNEFGISAALSRAAQGESRLSPALAKLEGARRVLELARAALGPEPRKPEQVSATPRRSYQETVAMLAAVSDEIGRRERMVAAAEGELRSLGDPDALEAELERKREELGRRQEEFDALSLAIACMAAANETMQARFSPALNQRAGELMATLTGGKYDQLTLTRTFEALARQSGEVLPHSVLALSQGTADQLYLAVRLAVCDLTLSQDDPPPLVLDDALANFDDARMGLALEHLVERGQRQQILLFTCHSREREYLGRRPGVRLVELR